jgi:SAM-dependent methyltransferase
MERRWADAESWYRAKLLDSLVPDPDALLLDVGCDDGEWTDAVRKRIGILPRQVSGLELVEERAQLARARGFDVRTGDLDEPWPFEDRVFDVVHANQVIEHVIRLDHFVSELRRMLARGGTAVVCTENLASWHNVASLALGWQPMPMHVSDELILGNPLNPERGDPHRDAGRTHLRLFTGRALEELCAHHGLERVSLRTSGYYPLPPRLGRLAARLDPLHGAFLIGIFEARRRGGDERGALAARTSPA